MKRYVIDVGSALKLVETETEADRTHEILAPTLLRSQVLDHLFRRSAEGRLEEAAALSLNTRFAKLKLRYLGDAVLRRRAWTVAKELGLKSTFAAEYIALTELQGDVLVTDDSQLAALAAQRVAVEPFELFAAR